MEYSVGQTVRVLAFSGLAASTGIVSIHNGDGTYDIIYSETAQTDEEANIPASRISALQSFEQADFDSAEAYKSQGNVLFGLKDFPAAARRYKKGLEVLVAPVEVSVGQAVLVSFPDNLDLYCGMVADCDGVGDVLLDDPRTAMEEAQVPLSSLQPVAAERPLQRSLHLNLARCLLKLGRRGWAIHHASVALALSVLMHHADVGAGADAGTGAGAGELDTSKLLADCYYFRGKALLAANRPKFADKDCCALELLDAPKARTLRLEVAQFKERTVRSNRKLAVLEEGGPEGRAVGSSRNPNSSTAAPTDPTMRLVLFSLAALVALIAFAFR